MTEKKLTALTDPDNFVPVWDDEPKPPVKKVAKKVARKTLPKQRS